MPSLQSTSSAAIVADLLLLSGGDLEQLVKPAARKLDAVCVTDNSAAWKNWIRSPSATWGFQISPKLPPQ
jgi:hypothetical protein